MEFRGLCRLAASMNFSVKMSENTSTPAERRADTLEQLAILCEHDTMTSKPSHMAGIKYLRLEGT